MSLPSKTAAGRQAGRHQVDQQRASILDAAELLFLRDGLELTSMSAIAKQAAINRVTLYRYFANRDEIAVEIQLRMMRKIVSVLPAEEGEENGLERHRRRARAIIRSFDQLRDAFRYVAMFDRIYLDNDHDNELTRWTIARLHAASQGQRTEAGKAPFNPQMKELPVIISAIIWFLQKLALRGEVTWGDPSTALDEHLAFFEAMIMAGFDRIEQQSIAHSDHPGGIDHVH